MFKFLSILFLFGTSSLYGQSWNWTERSPMPFRTANNAVCEAIVNGNEYVYSFGGIDTSKVYSGIHNRSFKYDVAADSWTEIAPLPDSMTKIAAAASYVNGKIYIIGGYSVFANSNEVSSERVHIYDPVTDTYETDGAPIPTPIDDQVQCVYKDSLIYVVTGWSNTANFPNVQIYDPSLDQWQTGTFVPTSFQYTAFGASGYILGDTLYYHGGAAGGSFAARKFIRKGYINPNDPTDISWELMGEAPGDPGYRAACSGTNDRVFWVGGSPTSYNYNGVAYNGSGGVDPSARILHFNPTDSTYQDDTMQPFGVMDLRGIAKLSNNRWIICGGMDTNQVVSNRTFLLENSSLNVPEKEIQSLKISYTTNGVSVLAPEKSNFSVVDISGKIIKEFDPAMEVNVSNDSFAPGMYFLRWNRGVISIRIY
ncbi:MAG: kelch repeat-containing protein [Fluviicola sp.]